MRSNLRQGFTLIELLTVIGIIVFLIALLLSTISVVRTRARTAQCQSHLQQIGLALQLANKARPSPVSASNWFTEVSPFLDDAAPMLICPEDDPPSQSSSYGANNRLARLQGGDGSKIAILDYSVTEVTVVVASFAEQDDWLTRVGDRHQGKANVLFFDGTVAPHDPEEINPRECKPFYKYWRPMRDSIRLLDCLPAD